jgi:subtilisin family serine protease
MLTATAGDARGGRVVRDARVATPLFVGLICVVALAASRDPARISSVSGIAYYNPAAAAGSISIVVRARSARDLDVVARAASSMGYAIERRAPDPPALDVTPPAGVSLEHAVKALAMQPGVAYAEPSYHIRLADVPSAPLYPKESTYLQAEHAPEAWDIEKGRASIVVAILDTGIDVTHPDLQGRIWTNPAEIDHNGVDDDGNGCIDDVHGCAFVSEPAPGCASSSSGDVRDDLGHGTFVSGVVAANGTGGMVGVARGVTIMPVKVLDCTGSGTSFALAQGILYAVKNGASLLNVSLGGPVSSAYLREAIQIARDNYGVLLIAATGNTGGDVEYPARYPEVLAVGAESAMHPGQRAPFSGAGPEVDVVAIGEGIIGTVPKGACHTFLICLPGDDTHAIGDGTSFAAPEVTGLVALMLSHNRYLQPDQIINVVKATADPLVGGEPAGWAGAGRINMLRALTPQYRLGAPGTTRG